MNGGLRVPGMVSEASAGAAGSGLLFAATALLVLGAAPAVQAQPRPTLPDVPRDYAITGARVVTGTGQTLERGTVVVQDGVITAVGANVPAPAGIWVIDGAGKTVYPGFFDALTTLGHPGTRGARPAAAAGPPGAGAPADPSRHSWGPEDRPGTRSWMSAAEGLSADERVEQWRTAGFTTVVTVRDEGLVTGQAALLNLGGFVRPREMVVATPVAMHLKLQDRSYTGFPGSLMGSLAYLKQLYLDADFYHRVWSAYEASPLGRPRPEWDPALEGIRAQLRDGHPVLFPGEGRKEIERAIATSRAMGVRPIVYGAQGGYAAIDILAGERVPTLVSLDWPTAPRDGDPAVVPTLEQLRLWDRAPSTPAELHKAGVPFAFYSGGISAPADMWGAVRKAVAHGLPRDAALRALTLSPAEIFGVADRLGTIEVGKIANLVVASGDIFVDGTRVETVLVDGERFAIPAGEGRAGGRGAQGAQAEDAARGTTPTPVPMARNAGPYREDAVTLLRNATVMTASGGTLEGTDILVRDGKIAQIGAGLRAPGGARVVDATGKWITPGIIDAHSHLASEAVNEGTVNVSSMVAIKDVLDPTDVGLYYALAGGVTAINILHGSANPIGGQSAVIKLRWGSDAAELLVEDAPAAIKFALGENTKRERTPPRYPGTRMGVQDVVRQAFMDAREYQKGWDAWEASGRGGVEPRRDLGLEALAEVLSGDRRVHAHSYRADETLQLMRVAEENGFRVRTFEHVLEGYRVADELAAHGAGAATFSDWWAFKVEAYEAIPHNAALMEERGVLVSIKSDSGEEIRHLNQEAAKAMKWGGMAEENALRLVTLNPAIQLGIDHRTGSIEVGKDADLAVWDGHPLSVFSKAVQTYVDGKLYFDIDMDRERQRAIEEEKAALLERHGNRSEGRAAPQVRSASASGEEVVR